MIDQQLLKYLTDEQQTRVRTYEKLFGHEGWQLFLELVKTSLQDSIEQELAAKSWDEVLTQRGRRAVLSELDNFEGTVAFEFEQLAQANHDREVEAQISDEMEYE